MDKIFMRKTKLPEGYSGHIRPRASGFLCSQAESGSPVDATVEGPDGCVPILIAMDHDNVVVSNRKNNTHQYSAKHSVGSIIKDGSAALYHLTILFLDTRTNGVNMSSIILLFHSSDHRISAHLPPCIALNLAL